MHLSHMKSLIVDTLLILHRKQSFISSCSSTFFSRPTRQVVRQFPISLKMQTFNDNPKLVVSISPPPSIQYIKSKLGTISFDTERALDASDDPIAFIPKQKKAALIY